MTARPHGTSPSDRETTTEHSRAARSESESVYAAIVGALIGVAIAVLMERAGVVLPLSGGKFFGAVPGIGGGTSLGAVAGLAGGATAAAASLVGFLRTQLHGPRTFDVATWRNVVVVGSVVLAHAVLAALLTYVGYAIVERGFIGLQFNPFWTAVLLAVTLGLCAHWAYGSVAHLNSQRMSTLLLTFVTVGVFTAMVNTPDPNWWKVNFSHLGMFRHISSVLFNGTLLVGGVLVSTFSLYLSRDMNRLVETGLLTNPRGPRAYSALVALLGLALAGVGVVPASLSLVLHNVFAFSIGVIFAVLILTGPWLVRGLPLAYFLATLGFLAAIVGAFVLTNVGWLTVTALEIIIFAVVFGWISVFIGFLGLTSTSESSVSLTP